VLFDSSYNIKAASVRLCGRHLRRGGAGIFCCGGERGRGAACLRNSSDRKSSAGEAAKLSLASFPHGVLKTPATLLFVAKCSAGYLARSCEELICARLAAIRRRGGTEAGGRGGVVSGSGVEPAGVPGLPLLQKNTAGTLGKVRNGANGNVQGVGGSSERRRGIESG